VERRLRRAGVDELVVAEVVDKLRAHGLLDDTAFAEYWVEQRQTFRPRGARLLRAELAHKGIEPAVARAAAEAATLSADEDAYRAAARHARQLRGADERTFKARLGQWLARRGFGWETTASVVERLWAEATLANASHD
jgi:regulatory protein